MDPVQVTIGAFWIGLLVGLGSAVLIKQFVMDELRPHPRNNKQYHPPTGDKETEIPDDETF